MANFNFISLSINVIEALARSATLTVLHMDTHSPALPLSERAAELLSRSKSIRYLTLNSHTINAAAAQWLSRSETIAHLELQGCSLDGPALVHVLQTPYLRYLNISTRMHFSCLVAQS